MSLPVGELRRLGEDGIDVESGVETSALHISPQAVLRARRQASLSRRLTWTVCN
jgi:hypothetical protein